jgi:hypothetical protein
MFILEKEGLRKISSLLKAGTLFTLCVEGCADMYEGLLGYNISVGIESGTCIILELINCAKLYSKPVSLVSGKQCCSSVEAHIRNS